MRYGDWATGYLSNEDLTRCESRPIATTTSSLFVSGRATQGSEASTSLIRSPSGVG